MGTLLVKNADTIVTCDDSDHVFTHADLLATDGVITYVGPTGANAAAASSAADEVIDARGKVVYPGLVNTHHHFYQIFTRNYPEVQNLELFPWLTTLYEYWKNIDPEVMRYATYSALGELVKGGCTTCFDHHYVFPNGVDGLMEAEFDAASQIGTRMVVSRGSMSLSKKDGGLPPDSVVQSVDAILSDSQRAVEKFHDPAPFSMRQVVLAPCSPFSVTKDLLVESAKLGRSLGVRLHTHLCETLDEERFTIEATGMRPLAYMESVGWVGPDVWFAHGIHFNDDELRVLAQTGTGVAHCPISNMKLSSGVARVSDMLKLGIPVGLGVDGSASNDGSSLLEEMRVGFLLHRLNESYNAPTGYDLLKIATRGGAKVLGRPEIGQLASGKAADLFMIDANRLELTGAMEDPKAVLAVVGWRGPVDRTVVAGKTVMQGGHLVGIDEERAAAEADACWRRFVEKNA